MLTHIVCWKYKAETTDEIRSEHKARLRALPGIIPEVLSFEVGSDILHLDRSFDTGLTSTFADRDTLDVYINHPEHQEVAAMGRKISEKIISVDFINGE